MYVLVYLVIATLSLVAYLYHRNFNYWKRRGVAHDAPHPLYGNMVGFQKDRVMQDFFRDYYNKYRKSGNPFVGFYFLHRPAAFILDTKLAKNILIRDFSNFTDRGQFHNERDDPLTQHLFNLDGKKWKDMRQRLSPTFTSGKMKFMCPTVIKVSEELVKVMTDQVPDTQNGAVLEIKELMARYTIDVIGSCAFGLECNTLRNPVNDFRTMGQKVFSERRHGKLLNMFMASFPELAKKLRMRTLPEEVHQFFTRLVNDTIAVRERENFKRNDFLNLLIELKQKGSVTLDNGEVIKGLSIEELAAQAFVFYVAGFETSSSTMSYCLYELAQNQDIQDRLRNEIKTVLEEHEGQLTYESINAMRYLNQVISETLRLYTLVPFLERRALNDYVVPGNPRFVIEKGTQVLIPSCAYHRDEDMYPDPETFDPDRFSPEKVAARDSVEWLAFGDGPRNCIGMRFGQMQVRIGLAQIISRFKVSFSDKTKSPLKYSTLTILLGTVGGIDLRLDRI
nr:cytochrome P450 6a2-like [Drosophila takahashii]